MDTSDGAGEERYGEGPLWLHPDDDLAPNRPGEQLHGRLAALEPGGRRESLLRTGPARLAGRPVPSAVWRERLVGEQIVGDALDRLAGAGWRVVHSVPLPSHTVISHLLIGPGGVFSVRTEHHRRAHVRVGTDVARIGRRTVVPCVRLARREAAAVSLALGRRSGFTIEVRPVLVFVAAARLIVTCPSDTPLVLREREIGDRLGRLGGICGPAETERLYGLARDRRTWTGL